MPGGAVHTATATKSATAPQARVSTGAVWRHSQITWTGYLGGICIASGLSTNVHRVGGRGHIWSARSGNPVKVCGHRTSAATTARVPSMSGL